MNKNKYSYIIILFSLLITVIISSDIIVNAEPYYDENGNYYNSETYIEESSMEMSELTSEDWSKIQENLSLASNNDKGDFQDIKQDGTNQNTTNDTWTYMLWGILFLVFGVSALVGGILFILYKKKPFVSVKSKNISPQKKKTIQK